MERMILPAHRRKSMGAGLLLGVLIGLLAASCGGSPEPTRRRPPTDREAARAGAREPTAEEGVVESEEDTPEQAGEPVPGRPDARAVARRAIVLGAIVRVADFPRAGEKVSPATLEFFEVERERTVSWLRREKLWSSASPKERKYLSTPIGTKRDGERLPGGGDPLLVVLWAIGRVHRLPDYDAAGPNTQFLLQAMPQVGAPTAAFIERAELRPAKEIEHAHDKAEIWDWRAKVYERVASKSFPAVKELDPLVADLKEQAREARLSLGPIRDWASFYRELVRFTSQDAFRRGLISEPVHGDFPALAKSYSEITEQEFRRFALPTIAADRLYALKWIVRGGENWDAVSSED